MKKILTLIIVFVGFAANSQVTVDPTFNPIDAGFGGYLGLRSNSSVGTVLAQVIQSDGKILLGGSISSYNDETLNSSLVRLNINGTRDVTFSTTGSGLNGGASVNVRAIAV